LQAPKRRRFEIAELACLLQLVWQMKLSTLGAK